MSSLFNFLQSEHAMALLTTVVIFLITIFLAVKRWIGFSLTCLLLLFSLLAGFLIDQKQMLQHYFQSSSTSSHTASLSIDENNQDDFRKQMLQAVADLKVEVLTEKENLRRVMDQVQEVFDSVEAQKQKLQHFIDETREHFKTNYPTPLSSEKPDSETAPLEH